ncbi:hypothetical protein [Lysobacter auxotrophicus]|uniref:hypothetical protein n=1 Tax=Lysobacter auxotrophicus TaxID=2992573 RepID=UPI0024910E22|nr:hypothetical protein [Lysobacter auxotrophicus]
MDVAAMVRESVHVRRRKRQVHDFHARGFFCRRKAREFSPRMDARTAIARHA